MGDYTIFLGDVALDEYYRVDSWPVPGGKAFVNQMEAQHGGMIANAACVYQALGGNARFMTALNGGAVSDILINGLKDQGVWPSYVIRDDSLADSRCMIFLTEDNNTVLILETGQEVYQITPEYFAVLQEAEYLYSTLSDLLRLRYQNLEGLDVVRLLRESGVKIFCDLDTGYLDEEKEAYYQVLDYAVFNHIGFARYKGCRTEEEAVHALLSYGVKAVAVTCGSEGCKVFWSEICAEIQVFPVEAVDATGAGDTFSASFLYGIGRFGQDYKKAALFASAAAAICVSGVGARAGAVTEKDVQNFMQKYERA